MKRGLTFQQAAAMRLMLNSTPWAIMPEALTAIEDVLRSGATLSVPDAENVQVAQNEAGRAEFRRLPVALRGFFGDEEPSKPYEIVGNAAVITIGGVIESKPSWFMLFFGGAAHELISQATAQALNDPKVELIVYNIDSPGGQVYGMAEAAEPVYAAQKSKPTVGIANYLAASAGYWYLSQCAEAVAAPTSQVGCVGVLMQNIDRTKQLADMGVRADLVSNDDAPFKSEGYPQTPVTPEALAALKDTANKYADTFHAHIARGRGIRPATVARDFGRGRVLLAPDALAARMVDRIDTLAETLTRVTKAKSRSSARAISRAADMVKLGLPTGIKPS